MLTQLRIASLGVIDDAVLELGPGFTAVTGETGAGKTMVVSSLGLLLGEKAETRLIRHGASRALVEGRVGADAHMADAVEGLGGELDDGEVLLTRVLTASRSRALVGGAQVPLGALADVIGERVTIHGQSEQLRLGSPDRQREVLDAFAGAELAAVLAEYRTDYARHRALVAEREALVARSAERARELAMLEFGLTEIEKADPQSGEDVALHAEARRLQAVDDLRAAARSALVALAGDDDSGDHPTALGLVSTARKSLAGIADADADIAPLVDRIAEAGYALADVAADLSSYLAGLDADPARLEWIASRLAALQGLTRRYGSTVDDVLAWGRDAAARVDALRGGDERIAELADEIGHLDGALDERAGRLTALRTAAASTLKGLVEAELAALAMPKASLRFDLAPFERGPWGADHVQLLFSANPGSAPAPLARVASGGELSRVRLALEVVLAADSTGRTFVFDEVDAGVGGAVALEIGRRLARLAEHAQVIVVTHLAQVAAFADRHYVVEKADDGQVTTAGVREVTVTERVDELARMMAGLDGTDAARRHAEELLQAARRASRRPSR
ncbi:DNA repair protein RecN [Propioniciclava tarda]|uniref:DNA repair protein RecN n=1 Tax=Propioniciclava tarda TaxID=433330 RepID=A0A4Q9KN76_PROTD|nr:DNA repair protein RecN [Propioniciclava tarda]TBT95239.1 DNA repair protein RecN [Propioniciclava tarda]SMO52950.1 DNA repair protein RecN (Recombination protein N) [Propioniciclava tarda]HOA89108.1 DNA repair protein RecN [Propioniciclava tarda]HQA31278.1 DNA repair protein RecN [Propioniciclava tarda]HQD60962.1 DNA repair protein RecN [Propioniciclava tarda]